MGLVVLSFVSFYTLILLAGVLIHPLVKHSLTHQVGLLPTQSRPDFCVSLATGIALFLLFFSLVGRVFDSYWVCVPLAYGAIALTNSIGLALSGVGPSFAHDKQEARGNQQSSIWKMVTAHVRSPRRLGWRLCWRVCCPSVGTLFVGLTLGFLHLALWVPRTFFSAIHFDPNRFGAEKLFNLQFQQAFTHGLGYPPYNLWFSNERTTYYLLPKALAGLASFFNRTLTGEALTGGILFHVSDTFYVAFGAVCLGSFSYLFLTSVPLSSLPLPTARQVKPQAAAVLSILLGLVPLLAAPARAFFQTFTSLLSSTSEMDLWSLSRIIDNTINEYPFWNYLWADNHAHSTVIFLQLTLLFWSLALVRALLAKSLVIPFFVGALAATVLMSHSGSVFIDLVVLGVFGGFVLAHAHQAKLWPEVRFAAIETLCFTALFALPDLLFRGQPSVRWYLVPASLATTVREFLNVNLMPSLLFAILFLVLLRTQQNQLGRQLRHQPKQKNAGSAKSEATWATGSRLCVSAHMFVCVLAITLGWPVVGIALLIAGVGSALIANSHARWPSDARVTSGTDAANAADNRTLPWVRIGALYAAMGVWICPEIVASNWDMGEKYMRYNTLFRFQFESFYTIPFLCVFAFGPMLTVLLASPKALRWSVTLLTLALVAFVPVQAYTLRHRLERVDARSGADGFAFLATERPGDWELIQYLSKLPGRVILAEECGIQPKPGNYSVAGRIAAYAGRESLCGWANHVALFHTTVQSAAYRGQGAYAHLIDRDKWISAVFEQTSPEAVSQALAAFKTLGVTHLVFGQWEKDKHPLMNLERLSNLGQVVYKTSDGLLGVVALAQ